MLHKLLIDPSPVSLHTVFEKMLQHSEEVSERCSFLSTCAVVSGTWRWNIPSFWKKYLRCNSSRCSNDSCTLGREIVTGEFNLLLDDAILAFDF